jgi:glycosyltransferase involved in cell wall biosynthesis
MRILFIALSLPYPPLSGHRLRCWGLLQALAQEGHETHLLSFVDPGEDIEDTTTLRQVCRSVDSLPTPQPSRGRVADLFARLRNFPSSLPYAAWRFVCPELRARVEQELASNAYDLLVCDTILTLQNLPKPYRVPVIMDTDDVPHSIMERFEQHAGNFLSRAYAHREGQKLVRFERAVTEGVQAVWVCSEDDRRFFQEVCPGLHFVVLPNVVNTDNYVPSNEEEPHTLLFQAWLDWFPNRDGTEFFAAAILPELRKRVPKFEFRVAGRGGSKEFKDQFAGLPEIRFTGAVPDMRAEVRKATVCVVPLRIGSGTRFKILEAAAMGKPIVSTTLGAEGLELMNGRDILIADEPQKFAEAVASLLADASRRRAMGVSARERVEALYSVRALRRGVREELERLSRKQSAAGSRAQRPLDEARPEARETAETSQERRGGSQ